MPVLSPINPDQGQGLSVGAQGNIMQDALHNLNVTLEKNNEERDTNTNITRPYFKGGKDSYLKFESYVKDFKTWTRSIKDDVRLLQYFATHLVVLHIDK